jgi:hypothetical protein
VQISYKDISKGLLLPRPSYCHPLTKGNLGYWAMLHISLVCYCTCILISGIDNFICRCQILKPIQSMSSHMRSISWQILLLAICRKALRLPSQQLRNKCRWPLDMGTWAAYQAASFHSISIWQLLSSSICLSTLVSTHTCGWQSNIQPIWSTGEA